MRILYVDDDAFIREIAEMALSLQPDAEVRLAEGGPDALRLLAGDWKPDVLLLDLMMPEMDGLALLREIRRIKAYERTPAIFVTARAQPHEHAPLIESGACGILTKPFDPLTFAADVYRLVRAAN